MKHGSKTIGLLTIIVSFFIFSSSASGVTWGVVDGKLMGASGVSVNGTLYDVSFRDGTCNSLFGDCIPSNFAFSSVDEANTAAGALLDQVLLDNIQGSFDSQPDLTNGIDPGTKEAEIITPYARDTVDPSLVYAVMVRNLEGGIIVPSDFKYNGFTEVFLDTTGGGTVVYAVWTRTGGGAQVPEPATILLLASGLVGIGVVRRKLKVR